MIFKRDVRKRLVKIQSASIEGDLLKFTTILRASLVSPCSLLRIRLQPVVSLVDEIGLLLETDKIYFLTDARDGFIDIATFLEFEKLFGYNWYARAESGEILEWVKPEAN